MHINETSHLASPPPTTPARGLGYNGTTDKSRDVFVNQYLIGAEVPCFHPTGKVEGELTFTRPPSNETTFFYSLMAGRRGRGCPNESTR